MIGSVLRFVLFRVFGARVLLVVTAIGWVWNRLRGRRGPSQPLRQRRGRSAPPRAAQGSSEYHGQ